jgi:membrane protein
MDEVTTAGDRTWLARVSRWPLDLLRTFLRAFPAAIEGYFRDRLPQHAAGIAYRVLFSLAPLAIILVSIVGIVLRNEERREEVVDEIVGWLPVTDEGSATVEEAIERLASPTGAVGLVSLVVFFWAATGMMAALRNGLEAALQVSQGRPAARGKLVDLLLVVGAGVLLIATIAVSIVTQVVTRFVGNVADVIGVESGLLGELMGALVPILIATVVAMLLYRFVPSRRLRFGDALAGGIVTGVLIVAISAASAFVYDRVAELSVVYGSITVVLVFLYSVYLYASAFLFGAEFASAWGAPPPTGPGEPLTAQLKRAAFGLFIRQPPPEEPPKR